jgi:prophage DNA circulation protein
VTWREELRRVRLPDGREVVGAAFRGVPFLVEASDHVSGRRAQVHEFPGRDDPFVEDLGRRARTFAVEGYVLGADYIAHRDALLDALEAEGPGELVHPYHGIRRAVCVSLTNRETVADGGLARFSIEFAEAPAQAVAVTEATELAETLFLAADSAFTSTLAELEEGYDASGLPTFAIETAADALGSIAAELGNRLAPLIVATQELALLEVAVQRLTGEATALVRLPGETLAAFREMVTQLSETVAASPARVLDALVETYGLDLGADPPATTATRVRARANRDALIAALRRVLAIEAARLAASADFDSHEEATEVRDDVAALLEEQAALADDTAYPGLVDLRSALLRAVPGDAVLASVVTIERRVPVPSLLLSYQLYGSVAEEADVLARNGIRHPGFCAGTLQVLTDV